MTTVAVKSYGNLNDYVTDVTRTNSLSLVFEIVNLGGNVWSELWCNIKLEANINCIINTKVTLNEYKLQLIGILSGFS